MTVAGEGRWTAEEVAARAGISPDLAKRFWRALGFPDVTPEEEPAFTDADVEALRIAASSIDQGVSPEVSLQMTRLMASSTARVAEAQVDLAGAGTGADGGLRAVDQTPTLLEYMWRRHLQAGWRRASMRHDGDGDDPVAVGFADLVGFTYLSQQLDEQELAELVDRFETEAYDRVVALGGRVVKMIGDEALFVMDDLVAGAEVALGLAEAYAGEDELSQVRVGLAWGPVLSRYGDVFGPVVNLASRIVGIAAPGSVVVAAKVHELLAEHPGFGWRSMRPRKLKGIGRVPLWVLRRDG